MCDYPVQHDVEIAAAFPIPSDELADRLVDLLLPRERPQSKSEEAA